MKHPLRLALTAVISLSLAMGPATSAFATVAATVPNPTAPAATDSAAESDGILVTLDRQASAELQSLSAGGEGAILESEAVQKLEGANLDVTGAVANDDGTVMLTAKSENASDTEALATARELDGVASAQLNYVYDLIEPVQDDTTAALTADDGENTLSNKLSLVPVNDPSASISNPATSNNQYWAYNAKLVGAWRWASTDNKVTVAVMDSGFNMEHEDLKANTLSDLAFNAQAHVDNLAADKDEGKDESSDAGKNEENKDEADTQAVAKADEKDVTDQVGHGTHVAGIIAGVANNGKGIAGASFNANILPIKITKVFDDGSVKATTAAFKAAYQYLDELAQTRNDIRVVNISLGGYGDDFKNDQVLHDAIASARKDHGILTVCAGGNGDQVSTPKTNNIYPGDWDECVSVTALDASGHNVPYSDYNMQKDISAPGASILSTWNSSNNAYITLSGSSMASPIVAGAAALLFSARPSATPDQVCDALYQTADKVVDPANDRTDVSGSHGALNTVAALDYLTQGEDSKTFPDVSAGQWFGECVEFAARHGIMNGYGDGTGRFAPEDSLKREQVACVLYNYLGNGEICAPTDKVDVDQRDGVYYRDAVNWAIAHGIMSGYGDGTNRFGVGDPLTREQIAAVFSNILANADDFENLDTSEFDSMPDKGAVTPWAAQSVKWALDKGVIHGAYYEDGSRRINPLDACTRAMMAGIMMNCIKSGIL